MISSQFAPATAVMLTIALIPTVIHGYRGVRVDDGLTVTAIPAQMNGMSSTPTARKPGWAKDVFASDDWIERTYQADNAPVRLFAARSYDPKRLYHHPELAVLRGGQEFEPAGIVSPVDRPDIPIHVLKTTRTGQTGTTAYVLLYDGEFVRSPILFQLRTSVALLVSGRRAMTLLLASDLAGSPDRLEAAPAAKVLQAAIESFETQSAPR
jgi:hypothetical protein